MVITLKCKDLLNWGDCVDGFVWVVEQTKKMHIVHVRVIVGLAHLVRQNAASNKIDSIWLDNNHVDLDTYWTIY